MGAGLREEQAVRELLANVPPEWWIYFHSRASMLLDQYRNTGFLTAEHIEPGQAHRYNNPQTFTPAMADRFQVLMLKRTLLADENARRQGQR